MNKKSNKAARGRVLVMGINDLPSNNEIGYLLIPVNPHSDIFGRLAQVDLKFR